VGGALLKNGNRLNFFKVIQRGEFNLLEEYVAADPIGKEGLQLVFNVRRSRNSEDVVKFLQSALFCF